MSKEYSLDTQKFFLEMMLGNPESFIRVQNIYNKDNFDISLREVAHFIEMHCDKYQAMPTVEQVNANTSSQLQEVKDLDDRHYDWFLEEFENFTKQKELQRAILKSADMLDSGQFEQVEKIIKDAVQISLTKDMGTDYFADPRSRLLKLKENNGQISTGFRDLDRLLFGGMNKGELNIFAGNSGTGKSIWLQNLAVNWTLAGLNGVYITLELSEELTSMRIDSMISNIPSKMIFKDLDDVEAKIKLVSHRAGSLYVKYMPAQSNVNDMRAYIKELQIKTGRDIDFIIVDYLDLLMPVSVKVSPSDLFIKDKYVSEELRNFARELDILFVTASQLNRGAVEEIEFDHSHISGGISKINTADNVFGIYTSRAMRERGMYQLQFMKTRSSSGVGEKINFSFDISSLRIGDMDQSDQEGDPIYKKIDKSTGDDYEPTPKINEEAKSNRLKQALNKFKTDL